MDPRELHGDARSAGRRSAVRGPSRAAPRHDRRAQLVDATLSAISQHGLSRTTVGRVARIARLSPGIVNFYFTSKDQLLLATLRHVAEEFDSRLRAAVSGAQGEPARALERLIDACFAPDISDPRKVAVWYAFWGESGARKEYLELCGDKDRAYLDTIRELCRALRARGAYPDVDEDAVACGLAGMIENLWQDILVDPQGYDRARARARCRAYLASVFPRDFAAADDARGAGGEGERLPGDGAGPVTLPGWTYHDAGFHALERERIFMPSWQVVCHTSDVPRAGDYATFEMLGERAFVVRGAGGELRAFYNVCRHRAHAVVEGDLGHCDHHLQCPYHGWTYRLDGALHAVPAERTFPGLDKSHVALTPVELEVFMGFVFVRFEAGGPSVAERLAPYAGELAHYRLEEMQPLGGQWAEQIDVDWKNLMDNYLEDYHFRTGHPGLSGLMNEEYERDVRVGGGVSRLSHTLRDEPRGRWSERLYHRLLPRQPHLPAGLARRWSYFSLFPGVNFDVYPDRMDFFQIVPHGPGRSIMRARAYGLPDARREMRLARYLNQRINRRVQREDNRLTRSVQAGLRSRSYAAGTLCDKEAVVRGFQDWIRAALPVAGLEAPPAPGTMHACNRRLVREGEGRSAP